MIRRAPLQLFGSMERLPPPPPGLPPPPAVPPLLPRLPPFPPGLWFTWFCLGPFVLLRVYRQQHDFEVVVHYPGLSALTLFRRIRGTPQIAKDFFFLRAVRGFLRRFRAYARWRRAARGHPPRRGRRRRLAGDD